MDFSKLALAHLVFTLAMVGVMTTVQLVVYPAFREVTEANFSAYVTSHGENIVRPLILFAPAEVLLALAIWISAPSGTAKTIALLSGLLLVVAWATTGFWYGPLHGRLANEPYDPARIDQLISTNWARTIIWWLRGGLATWLLFQI